MKVINMSLRFLLIILITLLGACATSPEFNTQKVDFSLTPISVTAEQQSSIGKQIIWGGVILTTKNLSTSTQMELLAYPLDSHHMPQKDKKPLGRFIIRHSGYLEATLYAQGRILTVVGDIRKIEQGKVGESEYNYPVIDSQQLHLWSSDNDRIKTSLHIGIGVGF